MFFFYFFLFSVLPDSRETSAFYREQCTIAFELFSQSALSSLSNYGFVLDTTFMFVHMHNSKIT